MVLVRRYATSTLPGSPAAMAGKKCVPRSLTGLTRNALAALPGTRPPPPSQVAPPSLDHTTYMSYSHEVSDCTVPAVDSVEHVSGFELRLIVKPRYGFPALSRVTPTKGVEESWPKCASNACCRVQVSPLSLEYEFKRA